MHFNTNFSSSSHRGAHSVENSWFHSNLLTGIPTRCCDTSNSLSGAECAKVSRCPVPRAKSQRITVRRPCRPVDWAPASYPLFTESLVQVLSNNAETLRWCPIMHEPHVLPLVKRHVFLEYWQTIHQKTMAHCTC
jgi:hypothetical protein